MQLGQKLETVAMIMSIWGITRFRNGLPKQPFLVANMAISSLAALYLMQPETIPSRVAVVAVALGSALITTEGIYYTARKIKEHVGPLGCGFLSDMESPHLTEKKRNKLSKRADSVDWVSILIDVINR